MARSRIALLWVAAALLTGFFLMVRDEGGDAFVLTMFFVAAGSLILAFVASRIWLGGRERR